MNAEDVPEQVITAALAVYLDRPEGILLSEDFGEPYGQMGDALAVALAHPDAQTAQAENARSEGFTAGQRHEIDKAQVGSARVPRGLGEMLTSTPGDLRVDPDLRVDAAYQRGFAAGRAAEVRADLPLVESSLGVQVDEEMRTEQLATLRAQRRHAEVAAEQGLDDADLARRALESVTAETAAAGADRERRWAIDQDRLPSTYVIRRDAVFAAIAHAHAHAGAAGLRTITETASIVDRDRIMDAVPWWEAQFGDAAATPSVGEPVGATSAAAVVFADQLLNAAAALREDVDSIHDSTTPGAFRLVLTDDTVLDVVVSEAPAGQ